MPYFMDTDFVLSLPSKVIILSLVSLYLFLSIPCDYFKAFWKRTLIFYHLFCPLALFFIYYFWWILNSPKTSCVIRPILLLNYSIVRRMWKEISCFPGVWFLIELVLWPVVYPMYIFTTAIAILAFSFWLIWLTLHKSIYWI